MKKFKLKPGFVINLIAIILLLCVAAYFTIKYWDTFQSFGTEDGLRQFVTKIQSTGFWGAAILTLIQALQVVVAFIPGEFVELAAGVMFGPWLGLFICLLGLNIGTLVIFLLVKYFGRAFVDDSIGQKEFNRLKFLNDPKRSLIIMFFIFIIPGIPKDVLIYPIPLTKVKMHHFMIMSTIARIPTVISSTFVGAAVVEENYVTAVIIFVISLAIAIPGLIYNKQICDFIERKFPSSNHTEDGSTINGEASPEKEETARNIKAFTAEDENS